MISDVTKHRLRQLFEAQGTYRPSDDIRLQLQDKVMVMIVGATCEGKNTVMEAIVKQDERFAVCGTFTSRPPRESDDPNLYTYYEDSDAGLAPLFRRIDDRKVVQYAVNPHAHLIYGSEVKDYPKHYMLGDVLASAVEGFKQLGFQRTVTVTIINEPDIWLRRFKARFPNGHPQRVARRDEAIESFRWSLAQPDVSHFWVENIDGHPEIAARDVIDIVLGASRGDGAAHTLAAASIETARTITL